MTQQDRIRVLVSQDSGMWIGQCLEYDIAAQASDFATMKDRLLATIEAERRLTLEQTGKEFGGLDPAPEALRRRWEEPSVRMIPDSAEADGQVQYKLCA